METQTQMKQEADTKTETQEKTNEYIEVNTKTYLEAKTDTETNVGHINIKKYGVRGRYMYQEVKITIKYVPNELPPNKNLSYDVSDIDINKKYIKETLGEDLSVDLANAIREG